MKMNELFGVGPAKVAALTARMNRLGIRPEAIEETFVKGGGKGGQKINKTANAVQLRYAPLKIVIRTQDDRKRSINRFLALRRLVDRAEAIVSPETSPGRASADRKKKQKARRRRRSRSARQNPARDGGESAPDL